ncbi:hypothetical protein [Pararhizobium sp. O133]|uniref:hypothetical protein n=1 Tax=Pararhizobium sp. O133 TaxID=3449278 RepID=UPI003F6853CE
MTSDNFASKKAVENDHYRYLSEAPAALPEHAAIARKLPVPMLPSEIVRIETAMYFAQVSDKTIRKWAQRDGVGRQADKHSPLQISFPALLMRLDGASQALELLRCGERHHPLVAAYLSRGIDLLEEIRGGGR